MPRKSAAPKQPNTLPDQPIAPTEGKRVLDWDAIGRDYRTGIKTLRQIASEHGITHGAVNKHAKNEGWVRDLKPKIQAEADELVSRAAVSNEVSKEDKVSERAVIEANAEIQYRIRMSHRKGLSKLCAVKETLLAHIESVAVNLDDLGDIVEMMRNPDDKGQDKANDRLRKAMERSTVIDDLKKLAEIDEKIRKGEREAFSITDAPGSDTPEDAFGKFLSALSARGSRLPMGSGQ